MSDDTSVKPWQSKTLWTSVILAALPMIPGVGPMVSGFIADNPAVASALTGAIFAGLRFATKGKIVLN